MNALDETVGDINTDVTKIPFAWQTGLIYLYHPSRIQI